MSLLALKRPRLTASERRRLLTGLLFISPWLIGFLMWIVYPLLASLYYSFTRYDLIRPPVFIGLDNYIDLFTRDPHFRVVIPNTFYYVGLGTPLSVATAFLLATLLNTHIHGRPVFRAIFFFPAIVPATVIAYDPDALQQAIVIDRGANAGIQVGMPVVSPDFLVGLVTEVEADRARVTLLIDSSMQIGALLQESRAEGIVYGQWQRGGLLELRHLDPNTPVREGELVVTSGRTARVPAGLVIGTVYGGEREVEASELRLAVRPLVDYKALRSVSVILTSEDQ